MVQEYSKKEIKAMNELIDALMELFTPFFDAYYELAVCLVELFEDEPKE